MRHATKLSLFVFCDALRKEMKFTAPVCRLAHETSFHLFLFFSLYLVRKWLQTLLSNAVVRVNYCSYQWCTVRVGTQSYGVTLYDGRWQSNCQTEGKISVVFSEEGTLVQSREFVTDMQVRLEEVMGSNSNYSGIWQPLYLVKHAIGTWMCPITVNVTVLTIITLC